MSEKVSAFWPVTVGRFEYLFFVVNWNDFSNSITESLDKNLEVLGQEIGLKGKVVQAYKNARGETYEEIKLKEGWPYDVLARFDLEPYPFMLVINTDFSQFNPRQDNWTVIWFSDFRNDSDSIPEIFSALVKKIRGGENLFDYFKQLRKKQASEGLIGYFEFKPGAFGISVDVKAILSDLNQAIQRKRAG